jgi:hypothetical protein
VLVLFAIAFLPTLVAQGRRHRNRLAIIVLNVLVLAPGLFAFLFLAAFGVFLIWVLLIAWAVALIWACTKDVEPKIEITPQPRRPALTNWDKLKAKQWSVP